MRHNSNNNMSLSAEKTPFKTMDIKAAFMACSGRKRKASSSQISQIDSKSPKLSNDESDVILLENDSTAKIRDSSVECFSSDCKENTDLNLTDVKQITDSKMSEGESENSICESSSDELNSSILDSSVNASLNTSGISVTADECNESLEKTSLKTDSEIKLGETKSNDPSLHKDKKRKKMTPEEAKKRAEEREKLREERELKKKELEEKRRQREFEKEQKQREKEIRKRREDIEKKERERLKQEKKEQEEKEKLQRLKEKEEKSKVRQMVLELKMEEKKRKEEQRLKREEEIKKAEEEKRKAKLEKEQKEKEKKERAKAHFFKFFVKEDAQSAPVVPQITEKEGAFLPFQVSDDMILAPVVPLAAQERFDRTKLDDFLQSQDAEELYLQILKSGNYKDVRCRKKERKIKTCDSDIIIVDNVQAALHLKAKLLQFAENVRPPYWGTWRKRSKCARPRNPFGQDEVFDYDVDSDDEWDEGGPGESLSGTENEDESEDDYEVDNEFFVPHGYLSEEENEDDEEDETNDPEKKKALLKIKLQEFEMERKQKTTELKPVILGCFFTHDSSCQESGLYKFLQVYEAQSIMEGPIPTSFTIQKAKPKSDASPSTGDSSNAIKKKIQYVPEKAMPDLIRLVHGNPKNRSFLVQEFQNFWSEQNSDCVNERVTAMQPTTEAEKVGETPPENSVADLNQISKRQLNLTIKKISAYGKCPDSSYKKSCWWVHDDVREKYGLTDVPIPNQWNYSVKKDPEDLNAAKSNSVSIKGFLIV